MSAFATVDAKPLTSDERLTLRHLVQHVARTFLDVEQVVALDQLAKHDVCVPYTQPHPRSCHSISLLIILSVFSPNNLNCNLHNDHQSTELVVTNMSFASLHAPIFA